MDSGRQEEKFALTLCIYNCIIVYTSISINRGMNEMALSIRNKKAEQLAREVAERCNTSMTNAIIEALEEKKSKMEKTATKGGPNTGGTEKARLLEIREISRRCSALPDKENRSADEILGYDEKGAF